MKKVHGQVFLHIFTVIYSITIRWVKNEGVYGSIKRPQWKLKYLPKVCSYHEAGKNLEEAKAFTVVTAMKALGQAPVSYDAFERLCFFNVRNVSSKSESSNLVALPCYGRSWFHNSSIYCIFEKDSDKGLV